MTRDGKYSDLVLQQSLTNLSKYNIGGHNKTTNFLLSMFGTVTTNRLFNKYLENVYLNDALVENKYERPLFFLFKVLRYTDKDWRDLEVVLRGNNAFREVFIMDYYVGKDSNSNSLLMFVYECPDLWTQEYDNFKKGAYSQFTKQYKALFDKEESIGVNKVRESIKWGIINKSPLMKEWLAKEFTAMNNKGEPLNDSEYSYFRSIINSFNELWDAPRDEEEIFRIKKQEELCKEV